MSDLVGRGPMTIPTRTARQPDGTASLPQQLQQAEAFGHRLHQFQVQAKSTHSQKMATPSWHLRTLSEARQPLTIQRQTTDAVQRQSASPEQSSAPAPPVQFFIGRLIGSLISPILKILFSSGGGDSGGGGPEEVGDGGADF